MKYIHWLKIDGYSKLEETALQFQSIENYLKAYPKAKAMLYQYDSSSTRLERFSSKPKNIGRERIFKFPEHYKKYIE